MALVTQLAHEVFVEVEAGEAGGTSRGLVKLTVPEGKAKVTRLAVCLLTCAPTALAIFPTLGAS